MKICPTCRGGILGQRSRCPQCGGDLDSARDREGADLVGAVIAEKYELVELIGEGAMGWVYRAQHMTLASSVAVKLMKPDPADHASRAARFKQEARAASRLNHPHILSVSDFGETPGGLLFIVSELLRGQPLSLILERTGPLPLARVLRIFTQILGAVEEAHSFGIVHRDIKPDNIIVTTLRSGEDMVKVVDFGIAKVNDRSVQGSQRITIQGQVFGTPAFMSPEQARAGEVTSASDLYSCGMLLFNLLAGYPPFQSESVVEVMSAQLFQTPPPICEAAPQCGENPELDAVVARAVNKEPADRFESASEFLRAFTNAISTAAERPVPCRFCGADMAIEAKFCSSCGGRLREDTLPDRDSRLLFKAQKRHGSDAETRKPRETKHPTHRAAPIFMNTLDRRLNAETTLELKLVDRDSERAAWAEFLEGDVAVLEVLGPVGTGKSALLAEFAKIAREAGRPILSTGADPTLARQPWFPIRHLVSELLQLQETPPERGVLNEAVRDVGLLDVDVPGLALLFGHAAADDALEFAVRMRETRAASRRALLRSRTSHQDLCVFFDDVDRFDGASLEFVREVARCARTSLVKIVVASETSILPEGVERVTVTPAPLAPPEVEQLLRLALTGRSDADEDTVHLITESSAGHPLHVTQAIRLFLESGKEVDSGLADLMAVRIGRLPTPALRLLQAVSAFGYAAPVDEVRALYGGNGSWDDALTLLIRRGFLLPEPAEELIVSHPSIADAVQESMAADARRALHREIFESLSLSETDPIVAARHAFEAKLGERSLEMLEEAAATAQRCLDDAGAALHLRSALRVARWELLLEPDSPRCLELSHQLAEALRYAGDALGAEVVLKEAVAAGESEPRIAARLWRSLAILHRGAERIDKAEEAMRQAVGRAMLGGDASQLTEMYLELGRVLALQKQWDSGAAELEEGVLMVTGGEGPHAESAPRGFWRLLTDTASLYAQQGRHDHAVSLAQGALDHAAKEASMLGQARSHFILGTLFDTLNHRHAAAKHYQQAHKEFCTLGDRRSQGECLLALANQQPPGIENPYAREAMDLFEQIAWTPGIETIQSSGLLSL